MIFILKHFLFNQVRVSSWPRSIFCELRDRCRPGGLWHGVVTVARVTALYHSYGFSPLCCWKKIRQTGLLLKWIKYMHFFFLYKDIAHYSIFDKWWQNQKSFTFHFIHIHTLFIFLILFTFYFIFVLCVCRTRPMSLSMELCTAGTFVCSLSLWLTASFVLSLCLLVSSLSRSHDIS